MTFVALGELHPLDQLWQLVWAVEPAAAFLPASASLKTIASAVLFKIVRYATSVCTPLRRSVWPRRVTYSDVAIPVLKARF